MTLLGVLTNPIHYKIFSYALMTMEISKKRFVGEWRSVFQFHDYYFLCLFLVLLSTLLIQIYKKKKMNQYCSSGLILFAAMALINARHVALFSLTVLPTLHYLNLWKDGENIITNVFHQKIILGSLVLLSAFLIGKNYYQNAFMDKDVQLDIVHYLDNKENLRIFNDGDGGVLSVYLSHNHSKIFFDTRNIIFNDEIYEDYFKMKTASLLALMLLSLAAPASCQPAGRVHTDSQAYGQAWVAASEASTGANCLPEPLRFGLSEQQAGSYANRNIGLTLPNGKHLDAVVSEFSFIQGGLASCALQIYLNKADEDVPVLYELLKQRYGSDSYVHLEEIRKQSWFRANTQITLSRPAEKQGVRLEFTNIRALAEEGERQRQARTKP